MQGEGQRIPIHERESSPGTLCVCQGSTAHLTCPIMPPHHHEKPLNSLKLKVVSLWDCKNFYQALCYSQQGLSPGLVTSGTDDAFL